MNPVPLSFDAPLQAELERAVHADDPAAVAAAIARGARPDARGSAGVTALMIAVDVAKPRAVEALLRAGADPNLRSADRRSATQLAVESYRRGPEGPAILRLVLGGGGDPNIRRPDGDPVIMRFVNDLSCDGIRALQRHGADLDILDRGGDPIVTTAAAGRDWDVVLCLLELGAAWDYENGKSRRPLSRALADNVPSPDSPVYPYKVRVWQFLHERGAVLAPLER